MNRAYIVLLFALFSVLIVRCSSNNTKENENKETPSGNLMKEADETKDEGIGKFKNIQLTHPLDESMIAKAGPIFNAKCFACHKLTNEKLVGPGWKGVTDRRTPQWIMNFVTNTSVMLDSDLVAQKMLVTCLVRMPTQGLTDDEARDMLEFMRKNDGKN